VDGVKGIETVNRESLMDESRWKREDGRAKSRKSPSATAPEDRQILKRLGAGNHQSSIINHQW
jgi:hypothetical protein